MNRLIPAFLFICCLPYSTNAQVTNEVNRSATVQYGATIQASASIDHGRPLVKIVGNAGIGYEIGQFLFPTYNIQLQLYNGGLGTPHLMPQSWPLYFDLTHAITLTIGFDRPIEWMSKADYLGRNSPLYYFSDFCYPALQQPYNYSVSIGTNFVQTSSKHRARLQLVGFGNIHVDYFQFTYANDGTPFGGIGFGDGKDRYYTGDGFAAVHLPRENLINIIRISYHKFTGYYESAFEVANGLFLNDVKYKDTIQEHFNRSYFIVGLGNTDVGWAASWDIRNRYYKDIQHNIHLDGFYGFHQVRYRYNHGLTVSKFFTSSHNGSLK